MCVFFQDDASSVLHGPAVRVEAAGGLALVPGSPGLPDLLPGKRRMELPADFCQNNWQRLTVSMGMLCMCVYVVPLLMKPRKLMELKCSCSSKRNICAFV